MITPETVTITPHRVGYGRTRIHARVATTLPVGDPGRARFDGLVTGATGHPPAVIGACIMQPRRARALLALWRAGYHYEPTPHGHYYRRPGENKVTPGKALADALAMQAGGGL